MYSIVLLDFLFVKKNEGIDGKVYNTRGVLHQLAPLV